MIGAIHPADPIIVYQDWFTIVGMRLSSTSFKVDGFPGVTVATSKTKLINVGDIPLTGITVTTYGLDEIVTSVDVEYPTSLTSLESIPLNFTINANSAWTGTLGFEFRSDQGTTVVYLKVKENNFSYFLLFISLKKIEII